MTAKILKPESMTGLSSPKQHQPAAQTVGNVAEKIRQMRLEAENMQQQARHLQTKADELERDLFGATVRLPVVRFSG